MTPTTALPPAPSMRPRHQRSRNSPKAIARTVGALICGFAALTLLALWRIPPASQSVMWAEDGNVFVGGALAPHQAWTPFQPYAGYLHVIPRLLAEVVVRFFPVAAYANAAALTSCAAVVVIAFATYHCSSAITPSRSVRAAWAAIPIFVNVGAIETLGNLANLHWYFLWLAPWLLIKPTRTAIEGVFLFTFGAAAALTEIIVILLVPLFLYKARDPRYWPARAGLAIGLACQTYTTLSYPRAEPPNAPLEPNSILFGWLLNTSGPIVHGDPRSFAALITQYGASPILIAGTVILAIVLAALLLARKAERWLVVLFLVTSIAVWVACVALNSAPYLNYASYTEIDWLQSFSYGRYSVAPTMFILAIIPVLALAAGRLHHVGRVAVLAAFCFLLASMYFPTYTLRDGGPDWASQVESAKISCLSGEIESAVLSIAPSYFPFNVPMSCDQLTRR